MHAICATGRRTAQDACATHTHGTRNFGHDWLHNCCGGGARGPCTPSARQVWGDTHACVCSTSRVSQLQSACGHTHPALLRRLGVKPLRVISARTRIHQARWFSWLPGRQRCLWHDCHGGGCFTCGGCGSALQVPPGRPGRMETRAAAATATFRSWGGHTPHKGALERHRRRTCSTCVCVHTAAVTVAGPV